MTDENSDLTCEVRLLDLLPHMKVGNALRCTCGAYTKVLLRPYQGQVKFTIEAHDKPKG